MYITEEDKLLISKIDIVEYAIYRNINLQETTKDKAFKIVGENLQGLYLYKNSNGFYRFSDNTKGNIIDFVKLYDKVEYLEACKKLLEFAGGNNNKLICKSSGKIFEEKELILPPADSDTSEAFKYLNEKRYIDNTILKPLFYGSDIKQFTFHGNKYVGFMGKNLDGEIKHISLRSIKPTYNNLYDKYDYNGSDKTYAFKVNFTKDNEKFSIYLFEAPIDLLSFINLQILSGKELVNKLFISAGGLNSKSINKCIEVYGRKINSINICFDNDRAGNNYAETLSKELSIKGYRTMRIVSKSKDFNEDLITSKLNANVLCEST